MGRSDENDEKKKLADSVSDKSDIEEESGSDSDSDSEDGDDSGSGSDSGSSSSDSDSGSDSDSDSDIDDVRSNASEDGDEPKRKISNASGKDKIMNIIDDDEAKSAFFSHAILPLQAAALICLLVSLLRCSCQPPAS